MAVDDDNPVSHEKVQHGIEYFMMGLAKSKNAFKENSKLPLLQKTGRKWPISKIMQW